MTKGSPRTQSLGHGIRVDHRSTCASVYPKCDCPKSWAGPQRGGVRGKRRTGFVGTLTEARAAKAADARLVVSETPTVPVERAGLPTLFEFARARLAEEFAPRVQHGTDRYESSYRLRIHGTLGGYRLDAITAATVREWCDDLVRREGDRRCAEYAFGTLHWLLGEAVDEGFVPSNVAAGVRFKRRARAAVRLGAPSAEDHARSKPALTRDQYQQVKDYAATVGLLDLLKIRLPVEGALRRAEFAALRWEGFDPLARTFGVTNGVTYTPGTGTVVGRLKNDPSYRVVVVAHDLRDLLVAYRAECVGGGQRDHFLFPGVRDKSVVDPTRPQVPNSLTKRVCDLIRRAGVVTDAGTHFTDLQGLRSTGASLAAAAGVPTAIIEAQLGHAGSTVFERHYRDVSRAPERYLFADVFEAVKT